MRRLARAETAFCASGVACSTPSRSLTDTQTLVRAPPRRPDEPPDDCTSARGWDIPHREHGRRRCGDGARGGVGAGTAEYEPRGDERKANQVTGGGHHDDRHREIGMGPYRDEDVLLSLQLFA